MNKTYPAPSNYSYPQKSVLALLIAGVCAGFAHAGTVTLNGVTCASITSSVDGAGNATVSCNSSAAAPGAPTIASTVAGNTQAAFVVAAGSGGTPSSYTVTCTESVNRLAVTGTSPLSLTGMTNGFTYSCSATATNTAGTSPASAAVSVAPTNAPPTAPDTPTVQAVAGVGGLTITVTPGANNGSAISAYTVTCTEATNPTNNFTVTSASNTIFVGGLTTGTNYSCTATATNGVGPSLASTATTGTPSSTSPPQIANAPDLSLALGAAMTPVTLSTYVTPTDGDAITGYSFSPSTLFGLTFNTSTGTISGTPNAKGTASVTWNASDKDGSGTGDSIQITVGGTPPTVGDLANQSLTVNVPVSITLPVTATQGDAFTCSQTSGTMPAGLNFNTSACTIIGTPTTIGSQTITWSASDVDGQGGSDTATLTVGAATNCPAPEAGTKVMSMTQNDGFTTSIWHNVFNAPGLSLDSKVNANTTHAYTFKNLFSTTTKPQGKLSMVDGNYGGNAKVVAISECPGVFTSLPAGCSKTNVLSASIYWTYDGSKYNNTYTACKIDPAKTYYLNIKPYNAGQYAGFVINNQ